MKTKSYRQNLAQIHFALGHARRLKIIETLEEGQGALSFEAVSHKTCINPSTLGHHMRVLLNAGLLRKKIKDPYSYYSFNQAPLHLVQSAEPLSKAA